MIDSLTHRSISECFQICLFCPKVFHIGKWVRLDNAEANEKDVRPTVANSPSFLVSLLPSSIPPWYSKVSEYVIVKEKLLTAETSVLLLRFSGVGSFFLCYERWSACKACLRTPPSRRLRARRSSPHFRHRWSPASWSCLVVPWQFLMVYPQRMTVKPAASSIYPAVGESLCW